MSQKKFILIGVLALVILMFFMIFDFKKKGESGRGGISQNILYITQPVTSFSGIVDKIEGNAVSISSQYTLTQTAPIVITVMPNQPPVMPTPKIVIVTYQVVVSGKTQIVQPPVSIPYLFKTITPAVEPKLSIKDIKVGSSITINSLVDLRTLEGSLFEATMINLPQKTNTLNGRISRLEGNILTIIAFPPIIAGDPMIAVNSAPPVPQEKEYRVTLTPDTEISRTSYAAASLSPEEAPSTPKTEKLSSSDLKKGIQVTIYTNTDVTQGSSFTALRIEPMIVAITPPLASGAAQMIVPTP